MLCTGTFRRQSSQKGQSSQWLQSVCKMVAPAEGTSMSLPDQITNTNTCGQLVEKEAIFEALLSKSTDVVQMRCG